MSGYPPSQQPPAFAVEEEDEDEYEVDTDQGSEHAAAAAAHAREMAAAARGSLFMRTLAFVAPALDQIPNVFKYGWVPFVAVMGLSSIYCTNETPAFASFRPQAEPSRQ